MITVVDPDAARAALSAGDLACPESGCAGTLRIWSGARARHVQLPGGQWRRLRPDRARCRACGVTHVLLPAWCLPRRAYSTDVVGTALLAAAQGAGHTRAAAAAGAPTATVRDWLRAVGRSAPALTAQAITVAGAAGEADACWTATRPCSAHQRGQRPRRRGPRIPPGADQAPTRFCRRPSDRHRLPRAPGRTPPPPTAARLATGRPHRRGSCPVALADDQRHHRRAPPDVPKRLIPATFPALPRPPAASSSSP